MRPDVSRLWTQALAALLAVALFGVLAVPSQARADDSTEDDADDDETSAEAGDQAGKKPAPPPPPPPVMPAKIDICMTSAVISPTKNDGSPWDAGGSKFSTDELKAADTAFLKIAKKILRLSPQALTAEIGLIFARSGLQALAKPDVFGWIKLAPKGSYSDASVPKLTIASAKKPVREFTPGFQDSVCFNGVAWHPDLRLRVNLTDKDLVNDDNIAMVELKAENVRDAFAFGKPRHIYVGDQDTRQLPFVVLNVTKSAEDE